MKMLSQKFGKLSILLVCLLALSACGKKADDSSLDADLSPYGLSTKLSGLVWRYGSGSVSPNYQYSVTYQIDFQLRTLVVSVAKGPYVTAALPVPGTRSLTDMQIYSLRSYVAQVAVQSCAPGPMLIGGGVNYVSLSTSSLSVSDVDIFGSDCTGNTSSNARQANLSTGYGSLIGYLQSL